MKVNGYVFTADNRVLCNWGVYIVIVSLAVFIISIIASMLAKKTDIVVGLFVIAFLIGLCIFLLRGRKRYLNMYSLKFSCDKNFVTNQDLIQTVSIDTKNPFYISKLHLVLYARGKWTANCYLLSDQPLPMIPNYEAIGLRVIKELSDKKVIILPVQDNTDRWVNQIFSGILIPQYPKVAYQPKGHLPR